MIDATVMNSDTPSKSNKFRLKHSTCKPCVNDDCNGTLVVGSKYQGEEEILTIICSNVSSHCHPPVTLAKFDYECKATGEYVRIKCYSNFYAIGCMLPISTGSIIVKKEDAWIHYECRSKGISPSKKAELDANCSNCNQPFQDNEEKVTTLNTSENLLISLQAFRQLWGSTFCVHNYQCTAIDIKSSSKKRKVTI